MNLRKLCFLFCFCAQSVAAADETFEFLNEAADELPFLSREDLQQLYVDRVVLKTDIFTKPDESIFADRTNFILARDISGAPLGPTVGASDCSSPKTQRGRGDK